MIMISTQISGHQACIYIYSNYPAILLQKRNKEKTTIQVLANHLMAWAKTLRFGILLEANSSTLNIGLPSKNDKGLSC